MSNPYSPPKLEIPNHRGDCPICGQQVGFVRFMFPFGYCRNCGNYLAIRSWGTDRWRSYMVVLIIFAAGAVMANFCFDYLGLSNIELFLLCFMMAYVIQKFMGNLVPAICWGWFALPDDERLTYVGRKK